MLRATGGTVRTDAFGAGCAIPLVAAATLLAALAFEYWGGYAPCPLCLQQRYAYYAAIPLCLIALTLTRFGQRRFAAVLFLIVGLGFLVTAGLAVYQSGAEWGLWPGPDSCAGSQAISTNAGDLLKGLGQTRVVRCDEAAWRFAGLSFAGWNAVISALLFAGSLIAAQRSEPDNLLANRSASNSCQQN